MAIDAKATFAIGLDTSGVVKPGDEAAQVLEKLKARIQADVAALSNMDAAMRRLKGGTSVNVAAFRELRDKIDKQRQSVAGAQADFLNLGGKLSDLAKKSKAAAPAIEGAGLNVVSLAEAAGQAGGPLGRLASGASQLKTILAGGTVAALAMVAALGLVVVAYAAAAAKIVSFTIASSNARRTELLQLEGLTSIRNWYGIAAGSATELQTAIDSVSDSSSVGRDKVGAYAKELYGLGLRGANLADALEATTMSFDVQNEAMASRFMQLAASANMAGGSVKALADDVRTNLGGIAKAKALDLNVQIAKLHSNLAMLFSGVHIEGFLTAVKSVVDMFSQANYTGRALRELVTALFDPLLKQTEVLGPLMVEFFENMIIAGLDFLIAVYRMRNGIRDAFGDTKLFDGFTAMGVAMVAGKVAAWAIVTGLIVVAALVGVLVAAWEVLTFTVSQFIWLWQQVPWSGMAKTAIDGLEKGLAAGSSVLNMRMSALADESKKAFQAKLEAHSPSRVFARIGGFITGGLVQGIDQGEPAVKRSLGSLVSEPSMVASASAGGASVAGKAGGASGGASVTIQELHYHSSDPSRHQSDAEDFRAQLERTLEGAQIQMGAA